MTEYWLDRWENNRTGWREEAGNAFLQKYWPAIAKNARVLVPLCGDTLDLLWLAEQGLQVTGVELSERAVKGFFAQYDLDFTVRKEADFTIYSATDTAITLYCGDYFAFKETEFDALYDRAALVALPADMRAAYAAHTRERLKKTFSLLVITLAYDQSVTNGPPWCVEADELKSYWPEAKLQDSKEIIQDAPPRFIEDGVTSFRESVWSNSVV